MDGARLQGSAVGRVGDVIALEEIALRAELATDAVPEIASVWDLDLPGTLPRSLAFSGTIGGNLDKLTLKDFAARLFEGDVFASLSSDWLHGDAGATVTRVLETPDIDVEFDLELASQAVLSGLAGRDLPSMGPWRGPVSAWTRWASRERVWRRRSPCRRLAHRYSRPGSSTVRRRAVRSARRSSSSWCAGGNQMGPPATPVKRSSSRTGPFGVGCL